MTKACERHARALFIGLPLWLGSGCVWPDVSVTPRSDAGARHTMSEDQADVRAVRNKTERTDDDKDILDASRSEATSATASPSRADATTPQTQEPSELPPWEVPVDGGYQPWMNPKPATPTTPSRIATLPLGGAVSDGDDAGTPVPTKGTPTKAGAVTGLSSLLLGSRPCHTDMDCGFGTCTISSSPTGTGGTLTARSCSLPLCKTALSQAQQDTYQVLSVRPLAAWLPETVDSADRSGWRQTPFPKSLLPLGPGMYISPNVSEWFDDATTPGMFAGASQRLAIDNDPDGVLASFEFAGCTQGALRTATITGHTGKRVEWRCESNAGAVDGGFFIWSLAALWPEDHSYIAFLEGKITDACEQRAWEGVLTSLSVAPIDDWPEMFRP